MGTFLLGKHSEQIMFSERLDIHTVRIMGDCLVDESISVEKKNL